MQHDSQKNRNKKSARKSGRASFDKSGRGRWEWETSTGVFETHITDEQLAELEASQLTILDAPKPQNPVSYWEWREKSQPNPQEVAPKSSADGTIKRLIKMISRSR
jgi:hypothetical protein